MPGSLPRTLPTIAAAMTMVVLGAVGGCRERKVKQESLAAVSPGELSDACAGDSDSLRPSAGAPAEGLWLYERPSSRERVAARIGPARSDDRALVVRRSVETMEVSAAGDTLRHRLDTATVSLELLPPLERAAGGDAAAADTTASALPAATYAPSPRVQVAAYEPCVTSSRGPRIRYVRRDATGRIVTDVLLRRASDR